MHGVKVQKSAAEDAAVGEWTYDSHLQIEMCTIGLDPRVSCTTSQSKVKSQQALPWPVIALEKTWRNPCLHGGIFDFSCRGSGFVLEMAKRQRCRG